MRWLKDKWENIWLFVEFCLVLMLALIEEIRDELKIRAQMRKGPKPSIFADSDEEELLEGLVV